MPRSRRSPRHQMLQALLMKGRVAAGLTQVELAARLQRPQSFVSKYEGGERRLDVVEFVEVTQAIGCDPAGIITALRNISGTGEDEREL